MNSRSFVAIALLALVLVLQPTAHAAGRTLKQGAGVGAGCNSIFNEADNGSGYTVEDTENALAGDLGGAGTGKKLLAFVTTFGGLTGKSVGHGRKLRQGAGVGQGCDSIFTEADNGSGYVVEDTENALAGDIGGAGGAGAGKKLLSTTGTRSLKQLNKIVDGADVLLTAAHLPQQGNAVSVVGNDYDNQGTNDAAAAGQEVGDAEASLPEVTEAIPGRKMLRATHPMTAGARALKQLNKIVDGADVLLTAAHLPQQGNAVSVVGNDYDNQGTNDAANTGQEIGQAEASLPEVTEAIPGRKF